jgi:hypothetical protein
MIGQFFDQYCHKLYNKYLQPKVVKHWAQLSFLSLGLDLAPVATAVFYCKELLLLTRTY